MDKPGNEKSHTMTGLKKKSQKCIKKVFSFQDSVYTQLKKTETDAMC